MKKKIFFVVCIVGILMFGYYNYLGDIIRNEVKDNLVIHLTRGEGPHGHYLVDGKNFDKLTRLDYLEEKYQVNGLYQDGKDLWFLGLVNGKDLYILKNNKIFVSGIQGEGMNRELKIIKDYAVLSTGTKVHFINKITGKIDYVYREKSEDSRLIVQDGEILVQNLSGDIGVLRKNLFIKKWTLPDELKDRRATGIVSIIQGKVIAVIDKRGKLYKWNMSTNKIEKCYISQEEFGVYVFDVSSDGGKLILRNTVKYLSPFLYDVKSERCFDVIIAENDGILNYNCFTNLKMDE